MPAMKQPAMAATVVLLIVQVGAQTPATDPLDPSLKPATNTNSGAYPGNIWITGPLAKVLQESGAPGAVHWATVYTTRNEIQSFQVHVHAGVRPINAFSVTMSDLVNARTRT